MPVEIEGHCSDTFAQVREALAENFATRDEIGSAVCIFHQGEKVVDLWGGHMDAERTRPWRSDTLCLMYSIAKSISALSVHMLADAEALFNASGSSDKTLKVFTVEEGGAQHCQSDYQSIALATMFDWLEDKL